MDQVMNGAINIAEYLNPLMRGEPLTEEQVRKAFTALLQGQWQPAQIAAFVTALRMKGETPQEVAVAASVMRNLASPVQTESPENLIDLCGTGGDGLHTFNISTACMFVVAAAGVPVAKHGGRSVSSSSGSADVLMHLGANINLEPTAVAKCISGIGVGFMFAPNFHNAMRHAAPVRQQLGVRTIFNILGPLSNPAQAKRQLMGVYHPSLLSLQAQVLQQLGSTQAMIVHGQNGMDEICLECPTHVMWLRDGEIIQQTVTPSDFGLQEQSHQPLKAHTVEDSAALFMEALGGVPSTSALSNTARDIVVANSAAALLVAQKVSSFKQGSELAKSLIEDGKALEKLNAFIALTQSLGQSTTSES